jgi:hypothetical protein
MPGSLNSPVVNTPGSLDSPVVYAWGSLDSPVINTLGIWLLGAFGTSIGTGLQQTFWGQKHQGIKIPKCISHMGFLTPWCILRQQLFLETNLGQVPVDSSSGSLDFLVMNTPGSHDSTAVNTLRILDSLVVNRFEPRKTKINCFEDPLI